MSTANRKQYEEEEGKSIDITFFDAKGNICEINIISKEFLLVKLSDIQSESVKKMGTTVEVYHVENGRWTEIDTSVVHCTAPDGLLLCHVPEVYSPGYPLTILDEMKEIMNEHQHRYSSSIQKRPATHLKQKATPDIPSTPTC